jgi:hypothetical protein
VCVLWNYDRVVYKTEQTNRLRSAADWRVASGVARVFGSPRRVIIMVAPNRNYKLSKVTSLYLTQFYLVQ